jgi:hypothetical protein
MPSSKRRIVFELMEHVIVKANFTTENLKILICLTEKTENGPIIPLSQRSKLLI